MTAPATVLTVCFGDRDRVDGHLLSDLLLDAFERHDVKAATLVRATEGFGIRHRLHTQRLLTLSEDLPLVASAVDDPGTVERLLPEVDGLVVGGLVTLERARLVTALDAIPEPSGDGAVKLTLYLGRGERIGGRPAHREAVDVLRRHGVAGATVVLGVDGLLHHARGRARITGSNARVPLTVTAIAAGGAVAAACAELSGVLDDPLATVERAHVCKRDGHLLAAPEAAVPAREGQWEKLTVVAGEQARHAGRPLYVALIHRLRAAGAAGATAARGIWGMSGDHEPHGDRLLSLRRQVPVVVTVCDRPERMRDWWPIVDELTAEAGLVTRELVPVLRAVGQGISEGSLRMP